MRRGWIGLLLLVAIGLLGAGRACGTDRAAQRDRGQSGASGEAGPRLPAPAVRAAEPPEVAPRADPPVLTLPGRSAAEDYAAATRYPPTAGPLRASAIDLIEWNRRYEDFRETETDPSLEIRLTADRAHCIGDESINLVLEARRAGRPVRVEVAAAFFGPVEPSGELPARREARAISFDAAPGPALRAEVDPSALKLEGAAVLAALVEVRAGSVSERRTLRLTYTPADAVPAEFTGAVADSVEEGDLIVRPEVEVFDPGHYVFDANLFDAEGRPIAWARFKGELAAGRAEPELVFPGRALLEQGGTPPYRVTGLRGKLYVPGEFPDLAWMPPASFEYITGEVDPADLSSEPWSSPQKRATLERLGRSD